MSNDISASLKTLRSAASHLNKLTDQANDSVQLVEAFLSQQCRIGTHASVKVSEDVLVDQYLEYRRIGSRYRIAVVDYYEATGEEKETPWSDCSREVKLETIKKLPDLLAELLNNLNKETVEAEKATEIVNDVMKLMTGKEG